MNAREVLARIEITLGYSASPRRLRPTVESELSEHFGLTSLEASEEASRLEPAIQDLVRTNHAVHASRGTFPVLTLSSFSDRSVVGSCFIELSDTPDVASAKARRRHTGSVLTAMQGLSNSQFEVFGSKILIELGASFVKVTPQSNDQGIDFYGTLNLGTALGLPPGLTQLAHDLNVKFAGQAKHYPTRSAGPAIVRELVGSIALARHRAFTSATEIFDQLDLRPYDPLVAIVFSTGDFTQGATDLASKAGVIARSGLQLAVFLADRGVGMKEEAGETVFGMDAFLEWLQDP